MIRVVRGGRGRGGARGPPRTLFTAARRMSSVASLTEAPAPDTAADTSGDTAPTAVEEQAEPESEEEEVGDPMEYGESVKAMQRENMKKAMEDDQSSDVIFVVGSQTSNKEKEFKVSRFLMAAISPVFNRMLFGHMFEAQQHPGSTLNNNNTTISDDLLTKKKSEDESDLKKQKKRDSASSLKKQEGSSSSDKTRIMIPDVSSAAFKCIVEYAYCNDPKITAKTLIPVRYACEKYNISGLTEACDEFLESVAGSPENVCDLLSDIYRYKVVETYEKKIKDAIRVFSVDIRPVLESKSFKRLCVAALCFLLDSDYLEINEDDIWMFVKGWADYQAARMVKLGIEVPLSDDLGRPILPSAVPSTDIPSDESIKPVVLVSSETAKKPSESSSEVQTDSEDQKTTDDLSLLEETEAMTSDSSASPADPPPSTTATAATTVGSEPATEETESSTLEKKTLFSSMSDQQKIAENKRRLLKLVYMNVRFGQMDATFFLREVVSEGILSQRQLKTLLIHMSCKEYPCKPFKLTKRKADASAKQILITRGTVNPPGWNYSGPKDALAITFDKNVQLDSVGMLCGTGRTEATIKVYIGDNDRNESECGPVVAEMEWSHEQESQNQEGIPAKFKRRVNLKKDVKYTIEIHQRNINHSQSSYVVRGEREIEAEGVTMRVEQARYSPNSTGTGAGAFPCFWIYRMG